MTRIEKLRELPCAIWDSPVMPHGNDYPNDYQCSDGGIDVHHRTGGGMAMKSDDEKTFPLCHRHHMDFHSARGVFRDWDKQRRSEWQDAMLERYDRILCDPEAF